MPSLYDITPFSLLDYPGEISCIAWFSGCNMRCVYCHNPQIVLSKGEKEEEELLSFLSRRVGKLTAVVLSGGEATLYMRLPDLAAQIKAMGFKVKLDTNGSRPQIIQRMIELNALDYVAMDYKCPLAKTEGLVGTSKLWQPFRESLALLIEKAGQGLLQFEVRTTFHPDLMTSEDLNDMIRDLDSVGYRGTYYIQHIMATGDKTLGDVPTPSQKLDPTLLIAPTGFTLAFRNA